MELKNLDINNECPIVIAGSKRGGTTLLRRIIGAHSLVTIPPPGWFYHFIYPHLYSYGNLNQEQNILELINDCLEIPVVKKYWNIPQAPSEIIHLLSENSFRGVLVALFRLYSQRFNKPLWGSKTPGDVFWLKEIQDDFPKAKFVFIYRDGRDVSIDQVHVHWGPNNLYTACLLWQSYIRAMREAKKLLTPKSYYELYYEELVTEPEKSIRRMCAFLELEYEPSMLRYYEQDADQFMRHGYHQQTSKPITADFVGIYKKLPLIDRQLQAAVIGDALRELGYRLDDEPRAIGFWERERYLEEDRHGGLVLEGAVEFKHMLKTKRLERLSTGVWTPHDKALFQQQRDALSEQW